MKQKVIDDAKIAIVYEALTNGVELEDNKLYYELLGHYPYFQKILKDRKKAMSKLARLAKLQKGEDILDDKSEELSNGKKKKFIAKYKFEQRFMESKSSFIDATVVRPEDQ